MPQLRILIERALSELGQFESGAFPITERTVVRAGETCGYYFCLHGPRSVKLTAVCDLKSRAIFFYAADGARVQQMPLHNLNASSHQPSEAAR